MTPLRLWERGHAISHFDNGDFCWACGSDNLDPPSPCPARTVRLSDNPAAVRMLKAMGRKRKAAIRKQGRIKNLCVEDTYYNAGRFMQSQEDIIAAVRAAFEYEPKGD